MQNPHRSDHQDAPGKEFQQRTDPRNVLIRAIPGQSPAKMARFRLTVADSAPPESAKNGGACQQQAGS
ncbi:hypothetical protein [Acetobacter malorum]|uniref:hypothetical protein n=1 Tax=Acetobacter malorum TaxID=178901 RepID=UPI001E43C0ED|nr:hypothetical protein [Acetobacter malorum]